MTSREIAVRATADMRAPESSKGSVPQPCDSAAITGDVSGQIRSRYTVHPLADMTGASDGD
jgi:hypothetical protein